MYWLFDYEIRKMRTGIVLCIFLFLHVMPLKAAEMSEFPLEPPDTSSPAGTLHEFMKYSDRFAKAMRQGEQDERLLQEMWEKAADCFDLSKTPPSMARDVGLESVLRLREILDRLQPEDLEKVPDKEGMQEQETDRWQIPHTEIAIGRIENGPRQGEYLFSAETVARLGRILPGGQTSAL